MPLTEAPSAFSEISSLLRSPWRAILESISDGVLTIDLKKRITSFNRAAESITGFNSNKAIGQYCFDIFRADICEKRCALDKIIATGNPHVNLPASIICESGDQKPINISASILKNEDSKIVGGVMTFRDLSELEHLRTQLSGSFPYKDIIGRHPKIKQILSLLPDIAESESPVLIEGPTGSGKEVIARAIHNLSQRKEAPFIAVNCAALPDTLLESELFGYAKGAFTGALRSKAGRFLLADKGTLFLDEIASTSTAFQADLLRVLEDGEFMPLGETRGIKADFRVVAATNLDLKKMVREKKFREDLYYRLDVVRITLPPLRERKEDIPLLINHFIDKFNLIKGRSIKGVNPEVLSYLEDYPFPGNIRELENVIEFAFIFCKGQMIEMEHLSKDLLDISNAKNEYNSEHECEEAKKIRAVLEQYTGNRDEAARALGTSRTTLWRKMKKHGLIM